MKRRCLQCREYFDPDTMIKTPAGWFCGLDHAVAYAQAKSLKQRQKAQKAAQKAQTRFYAFANYKRPCGF